jgi:hypothetical protein
MKRLLIILLTCASCALAGPIIHVSIEAQGDGSGLIQQAYVACLRNTPGVKVVPNGQPAEVLILIQSMITKNQ